MHPEPITPSNVAFGVNPVTAVRTAKNATHVSPTSNARLLASSPVMSSGFHLRRGPCVIPTPHEWSPGVGQPSSAFVRT